MDLVRLCALAACVAASPALAQSPSDSTSVDDLEALLSEEVETASAYRQQASEADASVTVITADEIERAGYRTLADVLGTVRSFYLTDDRTYARVGVRGLSRPSDNNNRIAVFVDGVPIRDGHNDAAPVGLVSGVPLTAVDRVEVIRGPGSTLYGTGALFAVVNVILKDTRTLDGARASASAGEFGSYEAEAVVSTDLPGGTGVSFAVHGVDANGPADEFFGSDAPGLVFTEDEWEETLGASGTVERGAVRLDVRYGQRTKGVPSRPYASAFGYDAWARDRSATAALRVKAAPSARLSVVGTGALDHYRTDMRLPFELDEPGLPDLAYVTTESRSTVARAGARAVWDASAAYRLVAGAEALSQFQSDGNLSALGIAFYDASDPYVSGAVYAQGEAALSQAVSLTLGGRFDAVRGDAALSPRGALVVLPDDRTALKLLVGTAFRAPSSVERTLDIPVFDVALADDLQPERVTAVEAIATREVLSGLRLEGSLFSTSVRDLIELRDGPGGTDRYVNAERAQAAGVEVGLTAVAAGWRTRASYGYQRAWDPDSGTRDQLSNAPRHLGKVATFGPLGAGLWAAVNARAESGRRTLLDTETDGSVVVDVALSADVAGGRGRVTVGARNVLDADYAVPARPEHFDVPSIPQRPRTAYLRLDVRL